MYVYIYVCIRIYTDAFLPPVLLAKGGTAKTQL